MGRKTWESLPNSVKPLPNRTNVVVSSTLESLDGVTVTPTIDEALNRFCGVGKTVWCIGGGTLYKQLVGAADKVWVTSVNTSAEGADTFAPDVRSLPFRVAGAGAQKFCPTSGLTFSHTLFVKKGL